MKITVCEFPDEPHEIERAWDRLAGALAVQPTDVLVLPEMVASTSFWSQPTFDPAIWRDAVARHAELPARLASLAARRIVGSRPVDADEQRLNECFVWTPARGLVPGRAKAWLPEQDGGWEATWFDRGSPDVEAFDDDDLRLATLVCSELMASPAPRALGQAGVQLIAVPRATGRHPRWEIATRMAAISAGAFVATANRPGGSPAGASWIVGPDGEELARTDAASPAVTVEIDLSQADDAKRTYPRTLEDPPGLQEKAS